MTDSPQVKRNAIYNLIGAGVPMLAAVVSIPWLLEGLGAVRFGLLAICWAVLSYFALFDFAIGRAVTQSVARHLATDPTCVRSTLWTGLTLALVMGLIAGFALATAASPIAQLVSESSPELLTETEAALRLLAVCVPVLTVSNTLRGFLEAHHRFDLVNIIRVPTNVFTFAGPLLVLPYSNAINDIVVILVLARLCSLIAYAAFTAGVDPVTRTPTLPDRKSTRELMSFGGWLTVTNIIGPILVYADRFAIAALSSPAMLAFYVTPWEVVTRIMIVPSAMMGALFPAISATYATDRDTSVEQLEQANRYVALLMFPITLLLIVFGHNLLTLWLGDAFAAEATFVMKALALGVFFNAFGSVASSFVQGTGRPDLTARVHLWELPFYLVLLVILTKQLGINGAAIAWAIRVTIDALVLQFLAWRVLHPAKARAVMLHWAVPTTPIVAALVSGSMLYGVMVKIVFSAAVLLAFAIVGWRSLLASNDRAFVRQRVSDLMAKLR